MCHAQDVTGLSETFNRTIVELKSRNALLFCALHPPFNRTIVELKYWLNADILVFSGLLIVP